MIPCRRLPLTVGRYIFTGLPTTPTPSTSSSTTPVTVCMPATPSSTSTPAPANFEVYHQQLFDNDQPRTYEISTASHRRVADRPDSTATCTPAAARSAPRAPSICTRARPVTATTAKRSRSFLCGSSHRPRPTLGDRLHRLFQPRRRAKKRPPGWPVRRRMSRQR